MTDASKGLRKALGRSASGDVVAIAEMSTTDLLASLDDEKKADLAAALAANHESDASTEAMPAKKKEGCSDDEDEDDTDGDSDPMASASDDRVKIVAAAVENDDACKGKAGLALQMLADDDFAGLNGNALVKMIGKTSVEGAEASSADPEAGARAEMKDALAKQGNSNIDANGSAPKAGQNNSSVAIWDQASAINNLTPVN